MIWKLTGPLRLNLLLWFVRNGRLPTAKFMAEKIGTGNLDCKICGKEPETIIHAL